MTKGGVRAVLVARLPSGWGRVSLTTQRGGGVSGLELIMNSTPRAACLAVPRTGRSAVARFGALERVAELAGVLATGAATFRVLCSVLLQVEQ